MSHNSQFPKPLESIPPSSDVSINEMTPEESGLVRSTTKKISLIVLQSEDFALTSIQFTRLKLAEFSCFTLAIFGFACGAISSDLAFTGDLRETHDDKLRILMHLCSVSTCLLMFAVIWRTFQELRWQQAKAIYSYQDDLFTTGKYIHLAVELLINLAHPAFGSHEVTVPHYVDSYDVTVSYQLTAILTVAMLARVYHPIRLFSTLSDFRSCRAQRICQMNGCRSGTFFAVKCLIRDKPKEVIFYMLAAGIFTGSFCYRTFERPIQPYSGFQFQDYGSSMWCVIITMTTVGYGDMYPTSIPGRFCGFILCIWGVLVVSMMVVAVNNTVELALGEDKAFMILRRLRFREELRNSAAFVLTTALRYRYNLRHGLSSKRSLTLQLSKFRKYLNSFQLLRLQQRCLYEYDSVEDRLEKKLNEISDGIEALRGDMLAMKEALSEGKGK
jgi:potassium intermediate/small conductance calcium-activated channel subfamily N protein 2